jgi:hypothetical protein
MSATKARAFIAGIFAFALVVSCAAFFEAVSVQAINWANLNTILTKLLTVYAAPATAVIAGFFAKGRSPGRFQRGPFWAAIGLCGIWNVLLVGRCVAFGVSAFSPTASGGMKDLLDYFEAVARAGFLVTGAITYFFAKPE